MPNQLIEFQILPAVVMPAEAVRYVRRRDVTCRKTSRGGMYCAPTKSKNFSAAGVPQKAGSLMSCNCNLWSSQKKLQSAAQRAVSAFSSAADAEVDAIIQKYGPKNFAQSGTRYALAWENAVTNTINRHERDQNAARGNAMSDLSASSTPQLDPTGPGLKPMDPDLEETEAGDNALTAPAPGKKYDAAKPRRDEDAELAARIVAKHAPQSARNASKQFSVGIEALLDAMGV